MVVKFSDAHALTHLTQPVCTHKVDIYLYLVYTDHCKGLCQGSLFIVFTVYIKRLFCKWFVSLVQVINRFSEHSQYTAFTGKSVNKSLNKRLLSNSWAQKHFQEELYHSYLLAQNITQQSFNLPFLCLGVTKMLINNKSIKVCDDKFPSSPEVHNHLCKVQKILSSSENSFKFSYLQEG